MMIQWNCPPFSRVKFYFHHELGSLPAAIVLKLTAPHSGWVIISNLQGPEAINLKFYCVQSNYLKEILGAHNYFIIIHDSKLASLDKGQRIPYDDKRLDLLVFLC